jgi:indoleacetamide hydrolase
VHVGTDSGGSIRNPACHCGVVGLMPRIGRLSSAGAVSYTPSLSSIGLIGKRVEDVALAFEVLAEPASDDTLPAERTQAVRLLVPRLLIDQMADTETQALFDAALENLRQVGVVLIEREVESWVEAEAAAGVISLHECGRELVAMDLTRASGGIRQRAEQAQALAQSKVTQARATAERFRRSMRNALADAHADAFVTPTWPFPAPLIEAQTVPVQGRQVPIDPHRNCFVRVANACNACAISLPMGLYECGVPAGLSLMGSGGERRLLAIARGAEHALPALPPPPPLRVVSRGS